MFRFYSTKVNFFKLFPKSTSSNLFVVNSQKLRKEYRSLQQIYHPDKETHESSTKNDEIDSQLLNKAYTTLKNPLTRAQYILQLNGIDVSNESLKTNDNFFLMEILEIHDNLENATSKEEIETIRKDNEFKINEINNQLTQFFDANEFEKAKELVIKLKYYTNIQHAISNWELGKPITLSH